ncbi:hypothetical protein FHX48_000535 [Microbacterium halimionae]|uniref:Uncharacterized protein n=1 Tax=Microbacterium halimionae TaxID=1526413 RepID=A0A7W3JME1_9MICO|nr:hypothetical protein [Microbacterium halimionae]MBA8815483.1 hypothetical protein [Microbacterium halimionae]NII95530.1 hypothetical protein [Microbacterium halimionae]
MEHRSELSEADADPRVAEVARACRAAEAETNGLFSAYWLGCRARSPHAPSVVADSLTRADVWATAAVVAGVDDRSWVSKAGTQTGMLVADDGRVARWLGSTVIETVAA